MTPTDAQLAEWEAAERAAVQAQTECDNLLPGSRRDHSAYLRRDRAYLRRDRAYLARDRVARVALPVLLAALRDARTENERLTEQQQWFRDRIDEHVANNVQLVLSSANDGVDLDAARRELAELRARIEALCEHLQDEALNGHGAYREVNERRLDELRAALSQSPAETETP